MRASHVTLLAASRFYAPLIVFTALSVLVLRDASGGVGFIAGGACAMALALHALVFGAAASRRAFPPVVARVVLVVGLLATVASASLPDAAFAPQLSEGGLFAATTAGAQLVFAVLIGRAPTLRDGDQP
jgi:multisubunit Na+/H+ antiporter MnhB subunit